MLVNNYFLQCIGVYAVCYTLAIQKIRIAKAKIRIIQFILSNKLQNYS